MVCLASVKVIASKTLLGNYNPVVFFWYPIGKERQRCDPWQCDPGNAWESFGKLPPKSRRKIRSKQPLSLLKHKDGGTVP